MGPGGRPGHPGISRDTPGTRGPWGDPEHTETRGIPQAPLLHRHTAAPCRVPGRFGKARRQLRAALTPGQALGNFPGKPLREFS